MEISTQEKALSLLHYDPVTGQLSWRVNASRRTRAGSVIKSVDSKGYLYFGYCGKNYRAHRIIWLMHYGVMPPSLVDHRDRDKTNNRIDNLRSASESENQWNRPAKRGTASGLKGACWDKEREKWLAVIRIGGKNVRLGRFETAELAHQAYCEAALYKHGQFLNTARADNDNITQQQPSVAAASSP